MKAWEPFRPAGTRLYRYRQDIPQKPEPLLRNREPESWDLPSIRSRLRRLRFRFHSECGHGKGRQGRGKGLLFPDPAPSPAGRVRLWGVPVPDSPQAFRRFLSPHCLKVSKGYPPDPRPRTGIIRALCRARPLRGPWIIPPPGSVYGSREPPDPRPCPRCR